MLGPVFAQELLLASRRRREVLFRRLYTGLLVLELVFLLLSYFEDRTHGLSPGDRPRPFSDYAEPWVKFLLVQQFFLLVLVTPAYTAGAITDEKTRGTLQHLLTAGVSSWEILLGKLFGRAAHVSVLALTALPLLCLVGGLAGVEVSHLLVFFVALAAPLLAAGAAGLLASVWCRTTRDAILLVYLVGLAAFLGVARLGYLDLFDPFEVVAPAGVAARALDLVRRLAVSAAAWGSLALVCLAVATWRLRPAYLRQLEATGPSRGAARWRPPVGDDPVAWKERYVEGLAPLAILKQVPRWAGMAAVSLATAALVGAALWSCRRPGTTPTAVAEQVIALDLSRLQGLFPDAGRALLLPSALMILLASLFVGVRASDAVTGERERQTWESLLLTPISARQLIRGKLRGILGATYPYLIAYAVPALLMSLAAGYWPLFLTACGLSTAWPAMWLLGAIGLWCSVWSRSSWRSLVGVLFAGYLATLVGTGLFLFLFSALFALVRHLLWLFDLQYQTALTQGFQAHPELFGLMVFAAVVSVALAFSWYFLRGAQKQVARQERVRYWPGRPHGPMRSRGHALHS